MYLRNFKGAVDRITFDCVSCDAPCEKACVLAGTKEPVAIRNLMILPVFNYDRCIGCGRCFISCRDGGHQAIEFDPVARRPRLIGSRCVGCHLCRLICSEKAIDTAQKVIKAPRRRE